MIIILFYWAEKILLFEIYYKHNKKIAKNKCRGIKCTVYTEHGIEKEGKI